MLIAIAGLMGSGKDTVQEYIEKKYGYKAINYADVLREIAREEGCGTDRKSLQDLRVKKGNTFLADEVVRRVKGFKTDKLILSTLRRSEDYEIPKKELGKKLVMILVECDAKIRFERLQKRKRDQVGSLKEFQQAEKREWKIYDFDKLFSYADYRVNNNGTPKELYMQLDTIMPKLERQ